MCNQSCLSFAYCREAQQYRCATFALMEKIRCSDEVGIQELLQSIRKPKTLSEAMEETMALKYF